MPRPVGTAWSARLRQGITPVGVICLILGLWGCLAIYNATFCLASPFQFVGRQLAWLAMGAFVFVGTASLPSQACRRWLMVFAGVVYVLLWLVLHCGIRINGMRGWFAWHGVFLQPSEVAKPAFVLSLAVALDRTRAVRDSWKRGYLPVLAVFLAWAVPIVLEPDFGMLLVYGLTFSALYWCLGGPFRHLAVSGLVAAPLLAWACHVKPHLYERFAGFLAPERYAGTAGWHILQFQRALASGGLFGQSWGKGTWSQAFLPLGYSDSIFATVAETVGLFGVLPLVLIILAWVVYGHWRLRQVEDELAAATVLGLVTLLGIQSFVHLSVNLGLLPPTGITLPLISYGGSSLVSTLACIGIVESLSRGDSQPLTAPDPQTAEA